MACVKTAISIDESLFEAAEKLAREKHLSRSALFSRAISDLLMRQAAGDITDRLDKVHGAAMDEEQQAFLTASATQAARLTEDDQW